MLLFDLREIYTGEMMPRAFIEMLTLVLNKSTCRNTDIKKIIIVIVCVLLALNLFCPSSATQMKDIKDINKCNFIPEGSSEIGGLGHMVQADSGDDGLSLQGP